MIWRYENVLPAAVQEQVFDYLNSPGWVFGWKSRPNTDPFSFWHKHFAGNKQPDHQGSAGWDCDQELFESAITIHRAWKRIQGFLPGHTLVRCYANGHPYGSDGTVHTDSINPDSYTAVYYPHPRWSPNWGGETVFFNREEDEIIGAAYPRPNRLVVFSGRVPHVARGVTRICPVLRMTLMFKTELRQSSGEPAKSPTAAEPSMTTSKEQATSSGIGEREMPCD